VFAITKLNCPALIGGGRNEHLFVFRWQPSIFCEPIASMTMAPGGATLLPLCERLLLYGEGGGSHPAIILTLHSQKRAKSEPERKDRERSKGRNEVALAKV